MFESCKELTKNHYDDWFQYYAIEILLSENLLVNGLVKILRNNHNLFLIDLFLFHFMCLDDKELFPSHFEYAYDITRQVFHFDKRKLNIQFWKTKWFHSFRCFFLHFQLRSLPTVDDRVQAAQRHLSSIVQLKTVDITSTPPAPAPIDYLPSLSNERNKPSSVARQPSIDERRALEHDVTHAGAGASIRSVDDLAQYDINAQLASILAQVCFLKL